MPGWCFDRENMPLDLWVPPFPTNSFIKSPRPVQSDQVAVLLGPWCPYFREYRCLRLSSKSRWRAHLAREIHARKARTWLGRPEVTTAATRAKTAARAAHNPRLRPVDKAAL